PLERPHESTFPGIPAPAKARVLRLEVADALLQPRVLLAQTLDLSRPRRSREQPCHDSQTADQRASHPPPSFTMASNAAFSSGMTLRRDCRTSGMSRSVRSALICSSVTGRASFLSRPRSPAPPCGSFAVGSGYASRTTSHTPTTAVPTTE